MFVSQMKYFQVLENTNVTLVCQAEGGRPPAKVEIIIIIITITTMMIIKNIIILIIIIFIITKMKEITL